MKKVIVYLLLLAMGLQLAGCGGKDGQEMQGGGSQTQGEGKTAYVAEKVDLPSDYIGQEAVYENTLYYTRNQMAEDTGEIEGSGIYQVDMGQAQIQPVEIPYVLPKEQTIGAMTVDTKGVLHLLIFQYEEPADGTKPKEVLWIGLDQKGKVLHSRSLQNIFKEMESVYAENFVIDGAGNAYISNDTTVFVVDTQGNLVYQGACNGYVWDLCKDKEGKVYAMWSGAQGETELAEIDSAGKTFGNKQTLAWLGMPIGAGTGVAGDLLLASDSGVFDYTIAEKTQQEKFKWAEVDVSADYNGELLPLADGRLLWIGRAYQEEGATTQWTLIRPWQEGDPVRENKKVLTLGSVSGFLGNSVKQAVVAFNQSNPDCRIEIKEYGTKEDRSGGITQLNGDIVSGNCPDILVLPLRFSMELYASKGVLEDLYTYIDQDGSLKRSDFQENILKAYETGGKLYGIPIQYSIYSMIGKTSLLGERKSWNLDELIAFADGFAGKSEIFNVSTKSAVLSLCLRANGEQLVSWQEGEGFNRELFLKVLEFSNRFTNDEQYTYNEDRLGRVEENQLLLTDSQLSGFTGPQIDEAMFGEPVTYIGFPSEKEGGSLAVSTSVMAISSKCSEKEAAWQFLGSMLSEEFQAGLASSYQGFPIRKSGLEKQIEVESKATYTTDENGNQIEQPTGMMSVGSFEMDMYAAKEKDVKKVKEVIESVSKIRDTNDQISDIISEESAAYFGGSKTAEEVADVVENRIQIYVNETK